VAAFVRPRFAVDVIGVGVAGAGHKDPDEDCPFYLTELPKMLKSVAFELRPDWAR